MDNTRFIKEGDVRKVIEDSTYTTTLRDLERRGKSKVRVVKARQIYRLIAEAVNQVVAGASLEMAEDERERLVEESRKELDRILGEHNREEEKFREQQRNIERHLRREVEGCLERIAELRAENEELRKAKTVVAQPAPAAPAPAPASPAPDPVAPEFMENMLAQMADLRQGFNELRTMKSEPRTGDMEKVLEEREA